MTTTSEWVNTYEWRATGYEWGLTDCASLVYWFLLDTQGIKLDSHDYSTLKDAIRTYRKTGGLEKILPDLGFKKLPVSLSQDGDILVSPLVGHSVFPVYGIVLRGGRYITSDPENGITIASLVSISGPAYVLRGN